MTFNAQKSYNAMLFFIKRYQELIHVIRPKLNCIKSMAYNIIIIIYGHEEHDIVHPYYCTSSKNSALLIIQHPLPDD